MKALKILLVFALLFLGIWGGSDGLFAARRSSGKPRGGHKVNIRESNRGKHEKADARRQREQKKAEERKEKNKKN